MKKLFTIALGLGILLSACKKPAGEGGQASIRGKVYVRNYNANFTTLNDQYYAQGERVYIIYGDEVGVGDDVRTSFDGSFEFKHLRKGDYKVFALSKDSTSTLTGKTVEVIQSASIKSKKEVITLPVITILN